MKPFATFILLMSLSTAVSLVAQQRPASPAAPAQDAQSLDFDLSSLDLDLPGSPAPAPEPEPSEPPGPKRGGWWQNQK